MKRQIKFSLLIIAMLAIVFSAYAPKRAYSMTQCGYMNLQEAETYAGYASNAAFYLGATSVSTHSYEMGPSCHGCLSEFCFKIDWVVPDPELNETDNKIKAIIEKAITIKDETERNKYLALSKASLHKP